MESVPGATFSVSVVYDPLQFTYTKDDICCALYLDGGHVETKIRQARGLQVPMAFTGRLEETSTGTFEQVFQFAKLTTHDGSVQAGLTEKLKQLGTICMKLRRCRIQGPSAPRPSGGFKGVESKSVPEKGL